MEFELFRVACKTFFGVSQIKVDDWVERLEVGELQLNAGIVVVLSVSEIDQIVQNSYFEVVLVIKLRVKPRAVLKATRGQSCVVVTIDVECVRGKGLRVSVFFFGSVE